MARLNSNFLKENLWKYNHADLVMADVTTALKHYGDLKPMKGIFSFNDGTQKELLSLAGTIPVNFMRNLYNIPVEIFLMEHHPYCAPYVFVRPTPSMEIKENQHVDLTGRVYLPYLQQWTFGYSHLLQLILVMSSQFGDIYPVVSKISLNRHTNDILNRPSTANFHKQFNINVQPLADSAGDASPNVLIEKFKTQLEVDSQAKKDSADEDGPLKSYPLSDNIPRGLCLIINNEEFTDTRLSYRQGSSNDSISLQGVFQSLNYEVITKNNCTHDQMVDAFIQIRNENKTCHDSIVICLMSHGGRRGVFSTDGKEFDPLLIVELTSTIKNKPKLVFIQACRGPETDFVEDALQDAAPAREITMMPKHVDYFFAYATVDRHVSYRAGDGSGSYFMQKVCENIMKYASRYQLSDILTTVVNDVSQVGRGGGYSIPRYQVPEITSRLTKQFFFKKD